MGFKLQKVVMEYLIPSDVERLERKERNSNFPGKSATGVFRFGFGRAKCQLDEPSRITTMRIIKLDNKI